MPPFPFSPACLSLASSTYSQGHFVQAEDWLLAMPPVPSSGVYEGSTSNTKYLLNIPGKGNLEVWGTDYAVWPCGSITNVHFFREMKKHNCCHFPSPAAKLTTHKWSNNYFLLFQIVRPSNHATIQSIVKAVGIIPGIPEPCCVPDKMSSLSVLFLDENKNVVLKVYPNMSVETCACR